ncbi:15070_t:CDS:10 [Entrophospora sp. SA101]|nr:15070_t:CDS:10 [Entrophospora sp. SA101]
MTSVRTSQIVVNALITILEITLIALLHRTDYKLSGNELGVGLTHVFRFSISILSFISIGVSFRRFSHRWNIGQIQKDIYVDRSMSDSSNRSITGAIGAGVGGGSGLGNNGILAIVMQEGVLENGQPVLFFHQNNLHMFSQKNISSASLRKQDLKKRLEEYNNKILQDSVDQPISNTNAPLSLPPASEFRTSLILPQLTKSNVTNAFSNIVDSNYDESGKLSYNYNGSINNFSPSTSPNYTPTLSTTNKNIGLLSGSAIYNENPAKDRPKPPRNRPLSITKISGNKWNDNSSTTISNNNHLAFTSLQPPPSSSTTVSTPTAPTAFLPLSSLAPPSNNGTNNDGNATKVPPSPLPHNLSSPLIRSPLEKLSEDQIINENQEVNNNNYVVDGDSSSPTDPMIASFANINDNNNDGRTYTMYSNNNTIRSSTMDSNTIVMNSSDSSTLRSNTLDSNVKMSMMYDNFKIVEDDEYQYNNHLQQKMPTTSQFNGFDNINSFGPASGHSDIAHQLLIKRAAEQLSQQEFLSQQNQLHQQYNQQNHLFSSTTLSMTTSKSIPIRKWPSKKTNSIKSISEPQLVSTSSNVKTVPIVQLDQHDDDENNRSHVFTSDSKSSNNNLSPKSSAENLPKKFISDENLNNRFVSYNNDISKRRAYSTRENNKPNEKLRQDIRNKLTFIKVDDVGDNSSGRQPFYDIDSLKKHAEMVTRYSNNKKGISGVVNGLRSRSASQSSQSAVSGRDSSSSTEKKSLKDLTTGSDSMPSSPVSSYSPASTMSSFSDVTSAASSPPLITPRNPLRNPASFKQQNKLDQKLNAISGGSIVDSPKRNNSAGSSKSGISSDNYSDVSDDKGETKDSRSARLLSIFNNSRNSSGNGVGGKTNSNDNLLKISLQKSNKDSKSDGDNGDINGESQDNKNDSKLRNKVIRRTIIITKPFLPPLPEGDDTIASSTKDNDKSPIMSEDGSNLLVVPTLKPAANRPPTPIPSPNTRDNVINTPYNIPIPPIPTDKQTQINTSTSTGSKRMSKSSIASSNSGRTRKTKSVYSDNSNSMRNEQKQTISDNNSAIIIFNEDDEAVDDEEVNGTEAVDDFEQHSHVEVLEMEDGSYVWQVINGLRSNGMEDHHGYYYSGDEYVSSSEVRPQDFDYKMDDDQVSQFSDIKNGQLEYHYGFPSPLHLPGVQPRQKQQLLTPENPKKNNYQ